MPKVFTTAVKEGKKNGSEDESNLSVSESYDSLEEDTLDSGDNSQVDMDTCPSEQLNPRLPSSSNQPAAVAHRRLSASLPQSSGSQAASGEDVSIPLTPPPSFWSTPVRSITVSSRKRTKVHTPSTVTMERWKDATDPDSEPPQHPFCPSRTPGPQVHSLKMYSVVEMFQLFFSVKVVQTLCTNTNKNAKRRRAQGLVTPWVPLTVREMYKFIGLLISMALMRARCQQDYWSLKRIYNRPFYHSVMKRKRFEAIVWTLCMSDPDEAVQNDRKKGTLGFDRLFRLRPLMDSIKDACRAFYHPHKNLCIDERMVASKARIAIKQYMKQYMKAKPTKWGFKLFVLANPINGYTCDFNIYSGKSQEVTGKGLGNDAVMDLLKGTNLGTGYHVYVDNFYTSTALFQELYQMKFGACGIISENGHGFPCIQANDIHKRAERGTIRWLRKGTLLFVKWMDIRQVRMCSTIHSAFKGETVKQRICNKQDNTWNTLSVTVPTAVKEYNKLIGGVDLSDALIKCYNVRKKTSKWYKAIFFHFVDIAVVNAFILHKEQALQKEAKPLTHKVFREELCEQLVDFKPRRPQAVAAAPDSGDSEEEEEKDADEEKAAAEAGPGYMMHLVTSIIDPTTVAPSQRATAGRKYCVHCMASKRYTKTNWKCMTCHVPLCVIADRNCFVAWHQEFGWKKRGKTLDPVREESRVSSEDGTKVNGKQCAEIVVTL